MRDRKAEYREEEPGVRDGDPRAQKIRDQVRAAQKRAPHLPAGQKQAPADPRGQAGRRQHGKGKAHQTDQLPPERGLRAAPRDGAEAAPGRAGRGGVQESQEADREIREPGQLLRGAVQEEPGHSRKLPADPAENTRARRLPGQNPEGERRTQAKARRGGPRAIPGPAPLRLPKPQPLQGNRHGRLVPLRKASQDDAEHHEPGRALDRLSRRPPPENTEAAPGRPPASRPGQGHAPRGRPLAARPRLSQPAQTKN